MAFCGHCGAPRNPRSEICRECDQDPRTTSNSDEQEPSSPGPGRKAYLLTPDQLKIYQEGLALIERAKKGTR